MLQPIDALSVLLLFFLFKKSKQAKEMERKHEEQWKELDENKTLWSAAGKWNDKVDTADRQLRAALTKEAMFSWFSRNSFQFALVGGLVTLCLHRSSLPGVVAGWIILAPKTFVFILQIVKGGAVRKSST